MKIVLPLAVLLLSATNVSAQWNPQPNWKDSYAVGGKCYCDSNGYDHNLRSKSANTPVGRLNVVRICNDIKNKLGSGPRNGRIPYNDIQCGHGPANDAADEAGCPGRVDIGSRGCNIKGPKWDLAAVYGGNNNPAPTPPTPPASGPTSASNNSGDSKYAVDGNTNTRWTTRQYQRPGQVFQLDLGKAQTIGKVILDSRKSPGDAPAGYSLSTSTNGSNYKVAATGAGGNGITQINFTDRSVRYIRITQTGTKNNKWWSIHDINVGKASGSPVDNGGNKLNRNNWVMYASNRSSDTNKATDDAASSRWTTGETQRNGQWFEIDLSKSESFNKIVLESKGNPYDYPRRYNVRVSNNGTNWKTVLTGNGNGTDTTMSFPKQTARYIRIEQTGSDNRRWWSIHDVNVYR